MFLLFLSYFGVGLLACLAFRRGFIRENFLLPLLTCIYLCSYLPGLYIPYIIDDLDHLFTLSAAIENNHVKDWLFTPHNEQNIPLLKLIYYFSYTSFGIDTQFFHLLILCVSLGVFILLYKLVSWLTENRILGILAACLWAATNLPDMSTFIIGDAQLLICLLFFLILFCCQFQYFKTQHKGWLVGIFISCFLLPATFSLGLTSFAFAIAFEILCIPQTFKKDKLSTIPLVLIAWGLSLIPYFISFQKIMYAAHYRDIGAPSAMASIKIIPTMQNFFSFFYVGIIPQFLPEFYLSMGIFFLCLISICLYRKSLNIKTLVFFLGLGIIPTAIVCLFRSAWGPAALSFSRYDVFPCLMLAGIYTLAAKAWLDKNKSFPIEKYLAFIYGFFFLLVSLSGSIRYVKAERMFIETNATVQRFSREYQDAFIKYFAVNTETSALHVKNNTFPFYPLPSLRTKVGYQLLITRYQRPIDFFSQYLLPKAIRERIVWGDQTDADFLNFLKSQGERYSSLIAILEPSKE